jgi:hypothetical protein
MNTDGHRWRGNPIAETQRLLRGAEEREESVLSEKVVKGLSAKRLVKG